MRRARFGEHLGDGVGLVARVAADREDEGGARGLGDLVEIEIEHVVWEVEVRGLCDVRGPASVAQTLYAETETGRVRRAAEQERRRLFREPAEVLHGRPTKRDRRTIDKLARGG